MVSKAKRGRGRPKGSGTKRETADFAMLERMARKGCTDNQICAAMNISHDTLLRWKDSDPDFLRNLKDWRTGADGQVERSLYERATGYSHLEENVFMTEAGPVREDTVKRYPPDVTACIFWLKNRRPKEWRDKQEVEHSGVLDLAGALSSSRDRSGKAGGDE